MRSRRRGGRENLMRMKMRMIRTSKNPTAKVGGISFTRKESHAHTFPSLAAENFMLIAIISIVLLTDHLDN